VARVLSPDPRDPDIVRARRSRGPRVPKRRRVMIAWTGKCLWPAVRMVIRAVRMAHDEQLSMWECVLLTSGAAPLVAAGPAALGCVAGRLLARRQPPAGPGPGRNRAVTRVGGRAPGSRPRHRQRIGQDHPEPPDRHPLQPETQRYVPPRRRPAKRPVLAIGTNTRAHHRKPAHRQAARRQSAGHPGQGAALVRRSSAMSSERE
jgi:hypothetical protein